MPLQLGPRQARVSIVPGDTRTIALSATLDGRKLDASAVTWTLLDMSGDKVGAADEGTLLGSISSAGVYSAPDRPVVREAPAGSTALGVPQTSVKVLGEAVDESGKSVRDILEVTFTLGWPQEWPYLSDSGGWFQGGRDWSDEIGKRAALVLYDLLLQLPDTWHQQMDALPIIRHELIHRTFHFPLPVPFIMFDERPLVHPRPADVATYSPVAAQAWQSQRGERASAAECELGMTFVHEFGHAYMTRKCGGPALMGKAFGEAMKMGADIMTNLLGVAAFVGAATVSVFALPVAAALFLYGLHEFGENQEQSRDLMSEYAAHIGWWTNNLSSLPIPFFGFITAWDTKEPPNAITGLSLIAGHLPWINLRNDSVNRLEARLTGDETVPELQKGLESESIPSKYACTDPHEDWAETCMIRATGAANVNASRQMRADANHALNTACNPSKAKNVRPVSELEPFRQGFVERDYFPPREVWSNVVFGAALGDYASWEIDYIPQPKLKTDVRGEDIERFLALYEGWSDGAAQAVSEVAETVRRIETDEPGPSTIAFLRIVEQHGDGLRRYAANDQPGEPKDLLIGRDGGMWVVTKTDEQGRILHATGLSTIGPDTKPDDFILPREDLNYQWKPNAELRTFVGGRSPAAPGYGDLERTLRKLVRTWGCEQISSGRANVPLDGIGRFFAFALQVAAIAPADFPLSQEPDLREVKAFCRTHGDGIRTWQPGAFEVAVGDWVGFYDENLFGVVTRADDGVPVDVLAGGEIPLTAKQTYRDEIEGLPPRAVKLLHIIDPLDVHYVWRPSSMLRRING
jgi:hypothetical protein